VSLHAEDDYPFMIMIYMLTSDFSYFAPTDFTGTVTEKGIGEGTITNFNYLLPRGTQDSDYCAALPKGIEDIRNFDPVYLLVRLSCTPICDRGDTDRMLFQPWR
jgi:acetoin utilization deacetylase AcuC-like enzyme